VALATALQMLFDQSERLSHLFANQRLLDKLWERVKTLVTADLCGSGIEGERDQLFDIFSL